MTRLHVAHVLPSFDWGGTQALTVLFAAEARRLAVDVTVVSLKAPVSTPYATKLRELGARLVFLEGRSVLDPRRILRFVRLIARERIDVLHSHLMKPNTVAPIAGALSGCPVLVGLHTLPSDGTLRGQVRTALETLAVRRSSGAISCAYSIARAQARRFGPVPITVVSNPAPSLGPPRHARLGAGPLRFVAVGRLNPEKGYDLLLDAAARVKAQGLVFSIVVAGDGRLGTDLRATCTALGLDETVFFVGARDDIPVLLGEADVYLSASRFEGLSIALLEAMGHGLAVIATDVGDTRDQVTPEVGILVPPDDPGALAAAMADVIRYPDAAVDLGIIARQRIVETRSPGVWAERLVAIYRATAAANGPVRT